MKKHFSILASLLALMMLISACTAGKTTTDVSYVAPSESTESSDFISATSDTSDVGGSSTSASTPTPTPDIPDDGNVNPNDPSYEVPTGTTAPKMDHDRVTVTISDIPVFSNNSYYEVHGNIPYFAVDELSVVTYTDFSPLDSLGRVGVASACLTKISVGSRDNISSIKPTGWVQNQYSSISGGALYNRSHLIAHMFADYDKKNNLMTGTTYFNQTGMYGIEGRVETYLNANPKNHVMYRVTPMFHENNLLASGALMEAYSVEDNGKGLCFCIFVYNYQPGIYIDHRTGENREGTGTDYSGLGLHTHNYTSSVVDPTCIADGYTLYTCSCGDSYKDHIIKATRHQFKDGICTKCGEKDGTPTDGQYLLFYPSENMVLTDRASGNKLVGASATLDGGILKVKKDQYTVLTLTAVSDGSFTLSADGKYLTSGETGGVLTFTDSATEYSYWIAETLNGVVYYKNKAAAYKSDSGEYAQYLEYYGGVFTTYSMKTPGTQYVFTLHDVSKIEVDNTVVDPTLPTEGDTYRKVTADKSDWSGKHLIVYEAGNLLFNGSLERLDVTNNVIESVSISGDIIVGEYTAYLVTISKVDGGYALKTENGAFFGHSGSKNTLSQGDKAIVNTISFENGEVKISCGNYSLRFNASTMANNYRFRYYANGSQQPISLYEWIEE